MSFNHFQIIITTNKGEVVAQQLVLCTAHQKPPSFQGWMPSKSLNPYLLREAEVIERQINADLLGLYLPAGL